MRDERIRDEFIGMMMRFAGPEVPPDWHACDGTALPVRSHEPICAVVGSRYGGDGRSQFPLPSGGPLMPGAEPPGQPGWIVCTEGPYPGYPADATAMETMFVRDEYLGAIKAFAGPYPPPGYMWCDGQELPIERNRPLFDLLSNRFGGDGRTSFRLPDMRARDAAGHPLPFVVRSWGEPEPPGPHWPGWVICVAGVFPRRTG